MKRIRYSRLPTEKVNRRTRDIDRLPVEKIISLIHSEDEKVARAVRAVAPSTARAAHLILRSLKRGGRLFFAGAGTSGRLGVLEAAECPPTFNTPPSLVQAVMAGGRRAVFRSREGAEDRREEGFSIFRGKARKGDAVVGIAASGVTPFVAGALEAARKNGAATILLACNSSAPLKKLADCLIAPKTGPEVITGSTRLKAGTATKLILNALTVTVMVRLGKVYGNWMVDLQPKSKKLTARAIGLISRLGRVPENDAGTYLEKARRKVKIAILMARKNWDRPTAAKKLKESSGFLKAALTS
jgi:N-acetylmuramic acid 6-phosphate etherase